MYCASGVVDVCSYSLKRTFCGALLLLNISELDFFTFIRVSINDVSFSEKKKTLSLKCLLLNLGLVCVQRSVQGPRYARAKVCKGGGVQGGGGRLAAIAPSTVIMYFICMVNSHTLNHVQSTCLPDLA